MKKRFESILSSSEKKNGRTVFTACVLAAVLSVSVAGCSVSYTSVQKTAQTSKNHPENSSLQNLQEQMAGVWRIDAERTDLTEWGTGISYGKDTCPDPLTGILLCMKAVASPAVLQSKDYTRWMRSVWRKAVM